MKITYNKEAIKTMTYAAFKKTQEGVLTQKQIEELYVASGGKLPKKK